MGKRINELTSIEDASNLSINDYFLVDDGGEENSKKISFEMLKDVITSEVSKKVDEMSTNMGNIMNYKYIYLEGNGTDFLEVLPNMMVLCFPTAKCVNVCNVSGACVENKLKNIGTLILQTGCGDDGYNHGAAFWLSETGVGMPDNKRCFYLGDQAHYLKSSDTGSINVVYHDPEGKAKRCHYIETIDATDDRVHRFGASYDTYPVWNGSVFNFEGSAVAQGCYYMEEGDSLHYYKTVNEDGTTNNGFKCYGIVQE